MDWVRWAALDQAKAQFEALAAEAAPPLAITRPVTPPQDDMVPEPTTPTGPPKPLTSSTASAAEVEAMLPPGQPRKTPTGKRVALEMLGEEEDDEAAASDDSMEDVKNNHGVAASQRPIAPVTKASRTMSPHGKTVVKTATAVAGSPAKAVAARVAPATQVRPVRVSPRIQGLANARKAGTTTPAPTASGAGAKTNGTNGTTSSALPTLPARRAREEPAPTTRTRSGTSAANQRPTRPTPSKIPSRKLTRATSPPPLPSAVNGKVTPISGGPLSRLPTLAPSKRTMPGKSQTLAAALPTLKSQGLPTVDETETAAGPPPPSTTNGVDGEKDEKEDAWMSNVDAKTAVEPGTQTGSRPSITRVRRRRSSFSSVDIL